ncbi:hypothetical protein [Dendronalium sp. ChiSLP03b]|nr:hypothetical protein [Dendronalium sp. ChiSLP03b]
MSKTLILDNASHTPLATLWEALQVTLLLTETLRVACFDLGVRRYC